MGPLKMLEAKTLNRFNPEKLCENHYVILKSLGNTKLIIMGWKNHANPFEFRKLGRRTYFFRIETTL